HALTHQRILYHQNIAGLLAEELQPGQACLVCVSIYHPHISVQAEGAPTKAKLEEIQVSHDKAQQRYAEDSSSLGSIREQIAGMEKLLGFAATELAVEKEKLQKNQAEKEALLATTQAEISTLEKQVQRQDALSKQ